MGRQSHRSFHHDAFRTARHGSAGLLGGTPDTLSGGIGQGIDSLARRASETTSPLSEDDINLWNEGTHYRLYQKMGGHRVDGGTWFAVWAPNAERSAMSREEFIARIEFPVTRNYVQKIIVRYDYYKKDRDLK